MAGTSLSMPGIVPLTWLVVHAGFHYRDNVEARHAAALEHLRRAVAYAERTEARLLYDTHW